MDQSIKPATLWEKFEIMKKKLLAKGRWNPASEQALRETLETEDQVIQQPQEEVKVKAVKVQPTKPRSKRKVKTQAVKGQVK